MSVAARTCTLATLAVLLATGTGTGTSTGTRTAAADTRLAHAADDEGVAIVNAAGDVAGPEVLTRLRKRLDALGALHPTPPALAAALEGGSPVDLAPIIAAYQQLDHEHAEQLLDVALGDLLATGDPARLATPVAELLHWRGLVAAALGDRDGAVLAFAASRRLAPDLPVERASLPPRVRALVDRARRPDRRSGVIELDIRDPELELSVDGGRRRPAPLELRIEAGLHLLVVTAPDGGHDAALVLVEPAGVTMHRPDLGPASDAALARRLRDDAVRARSDRARLERARPLADLTGARRLLVIEGERADELVVRVVDLDARRVSAPMALRQATRPSVLASLVGVDDAQLGRDTRPWHRRWYVWAVAGVVVTGAATGAYLYTQREPTRVTGF